jgi:DNA polymerase III alpha subunit
VEQVPAARDVWERYPDLAKGAWLEGNYKGFGVHAGGVILSERGRPINEVTALILKEVPKNSGNWIDVIAMDKKDAERQGLLKLDYLGVDAMGMLELCCQWYGVPIDFLYRIPLDDPATFRLLYEGDFAGVFQFDGKANRARSTTAERASTPTSSGATRSPTNSTLRSPTSRA